MTITRNMHPSHSQRELELVHYERSYTCDRCSEKGFGWRYRCDECDYDLHKDCMFNNEIPSKEVIVHKYSTQNDLSITVRQPKRHPSHPQHELELKHYKKHYTCDGCKEQGFGSRYRCEECNYDLHKECMCNDETTLHPFFKGAKFKFYSQLPPEKRNCGTSCDGCGREVNGFVYHCKEKDLDLHPCCHKLEKKMVVDGVEFRLRDKISAKCIWCNHKALRGSASWIGGWSYMSECKKYHFHVYCATEMVIDGWKSYDGEENSMALENLDRRIQRRGNANGGRGGKWWKIVKLFLNTVAALLLGDPTVVLTSVAIELITSL